MSRCASLTSQSGLSTWICPPLAPKPSAVQASTAYPWSARSLASAATSSLVPPKPCASSTAATWCAFDAALGR